MESNGINKRRSGELTPKKIPCPYGVLGDLLYVKETWAELATHGFGPMGDEHRGSEVVYRANGDAEEDDVVRAEGGWKSPLFMPRWASRITLEIAAVKVERLQDMSAPDAVSEGVTIEGSGMLDACDIASQAREKFRSLWDALNAARGFSWQSNPWVWSLSFRRVGQ
jgi:hypothetical protein